MSGVTSDPTLDATTSRPDTSHFNGLQTTGRDYRNLSPAEHAMNRDVDQPVPLRDSGRLLADVYRPAGDIELRLSATSTAIDTAWIVMLRDVGPDGTGTSVTGGWLRASLREVDPDHSRTGAPAVPCRAPQAVPVGGPVNYRIPLVPSARRFAAGHRIQLMITSDDQPKDVPVFLGYRHSPVGTTARNTIHAASRLLLPVLPRPPFPLATTPGAPGRSRASVLAAPAMTNVRRAWTAGRAGNVP